MGSTANAGLHPFTGFDNNMFLKTEFAKEEKIKFNQLY
jgi:hypothetical protein